MKSHHTKILSIFLSFCLVISLTYGVTRNVKADGFTFQDLTQAMVDSSGGKITIPNSVVMKLSEDIVINNELTIETGDGNFGIIELNGYKITVASGKNLSIAQNVHINSYDNAARDNASGAFVVYGNLTMNKAIMDVPNDKAIEIKPNGVSEINDSEIHCNLVGVLSSGQCTIKGMTKFNFTDNTNSIGVKVDSTGKAVIINYAEINAATPFDNSSGGKIYNFHGIVNGNPVPGAYVSGTNISLNYDNSKALDAAVADIKYTLDGSEPTTSTSTELNSSNLTASFIFNDTMAVKMLAVVDGQSYELDPLIYNKGVASEADFIAAFNNVKATGGEIYLAENIRIYDTLELVGDNPVYIFTGPHRLVVNKVEGQEIVGKLTVGNNINIEGYGTDGKEEYYSVITAVNGGELYINDGSFIRATDPNGLAINVLADGKAFMSGGAIYARKIGIAVHDPYQGTQTSLNMTGGHIEVSGQGAVGINAINGGNVTLAGSSSITAFGNSSTAICAWDHANVVIKGSSEISAENENGMGVTSDHFSIVTLDENCTVNSREVNGTAVISHEDGTVNFLSGTINAYGKNGTAFAVDGMKDNVVTDATANISGGKINVFGENANGVSSRNGAHTNIYGNVEINANGIYNIGVATVDNGNLTVRGNAVINANANADGSNAALSFNGGNLEISENAVLNSYNTNGCGISIGKGGNVTFNNGIINSSMEGGNGVRINAENEYGKFTMNSGTINVSGNNSYGINSMAKGEVVLNGNSNIIASGENSMALTCSGTASISINDSSVINSIGKNGKGIFAGSNGIVNFSNGKINVSGEGGMAIEANADNTDATVNISGGEIIVDSLYGTGVSSVAKAHATISGITKIDVNGESGTGACASNGGNIDIQGTPIISANGVKGNGVIVGTGGNVNLQGGTINAKTYGLNVFTEDKAAASILNMSSSVTVNVADDDGLGIIVRGEGTIAKIGDLTINAPKDETVDYGTTFSSINFEKSIPYTPNNLEINWNQNDYNGSIAHKYDVCGVVSWPAGTKINKNIFMFKNVTVNYSTKDINHDAVVDIKDLSLVAKNYNLKSNAANWDSKLDVNGDNIIDLFDLVKVSREIRF